jgi:hypothetical protein
MLDLLLLSKVGPSGILISKLLIHSNPTIQILLSSLPIVALPMLFGGVSSTEVFRMSILCLSTLGLSSVTGLYAASVCHSGKSAAILSGLILTAVSLGSYIVDRIGIGAEGIYGLPGLIQGFATASDLAQTMAPLTFWTSIQTMIILTTGIFILATRQLPRATIDGATNHKQKLRSTIPKSKTPSPTHRYQSIRRSPTKWLGSKRQWNPLPAFLFIAITMFMIAGFLHFQTWFRLPRTHLHLLAFPFLAHTTFKFMLTAKVTQLISDCRQSREMEILLSTPLQTDRICSGFRQATLNGFRKLFLFVILTDIATLALSSIQLNASRQDQILWMLIWGMIVMLAVDTWALLWIGLWEGSRAKNTINAYFRTLRFALIYPLIGFLATVGWVPVILGNSDSLIVGAILWWWIIGFLIKAPLTYSAIRSLSSHFRSAITEEASPSVRGR